MAAILLKYCGLKWNEKGETTSVVIDLIATLGFFAANNKTNQVCKFTMLKFECVGNSIFYSVVNY